MCISVHHMCVLCMFLSVLCMCLPHCLNVCLRVSEGLKMFVAMKRMCNGGSVTVVCRVKRELYERIVVPTVMY